jgi:predicted Fe-S protein YdhL (DUF1289 family)
MVDDSPCNGVCRMEGTRCISCHRTYDDLEQWFYMSNEARLNRMKQIKNEFSRKHKQKKESRNK